VIRRGGVAAGDVLGEDFRLLPQRRYEPVDTAAAQSDLRIRFDAGRNHDHVAVKRGAVLEHNSGHRIVTQNPARQFFHMDVDAHRFHGGFKDRAGVSIQLHLHEMPCQMYDVYFATVIDEPTRCFEA
jgi:hypothetical protein